MATKKVQIWKRDKWNMINAEVRGREIEVIEISDQWGEESRTFYSRAELKHWVEQRFAPERFNGTEEERAHIVEQFEGL
ncbi:hypothetical protein FE782_02685 [Paenibacillus antri]|uniref:Uncharacterized protein n=1 Tax=Paenibacillus antri TaxID=2582848 RepID=A0A5R9GL41_9BACL|nr:MULTISPECIES: hypothetical protein [Paenibacillus]TLS54268.1 hypothetical protein FE782_02685 [Paenibacillus antri]